LNGGGEFSGGETKQFIDECGVWLFFISWKKYQTKTIWLYYYTSWCFSVKHSLVK